MKTPSIMKNNLIWQKWVGNKRKTIFNSIFFQPTPRRPLPSYNAAQLTCVHRRRSSGDQNGLGRKINLQAAKKKIFYIFWFIYLWSPRRKKSFAQQADVGCLYCGFLFKMGDSDNLSSGEAPENPLKIRIYSSFFSRKKEEIIIILEKRFHDTHKWIIFKSFKTHNQD